MRVRLTDEAKADIREIRQYITPRNKPAADRLVKEMRARCALLGKVPGMGRDQGHHRPGLCSSMVGNYFIFYRVTDAVEILRVVHQARVRRSTDFEAALVCADRSA